MKRVVLLFLLLAAALAAQTHSATLTYTDPNPAGGTYTIMRASGLCTGTPAYSSVATGVTTLTYVDNTVTVGNYCYEVLVTIGGIQSTPSNAMGGAIAPLPIVIVSVSVK